MITVELVLEDILLELKLNKLKVALVPGYNQRMIRAVEGVNPEWYQELCSLYPSKRSKKKFDTKIKRRNILSVINVLMKKGCSRSIYADFIIDLAYKRFEEWKDIECDNIPF